MAEESVSQQGHEATTDNTKKIIFTEPFLRDLIKDTPTHPSHLQDAPELSLDDIHAYTFKKRKKRRSSGEFIHIDTVDTFGYLIGLEENDFTTGLDESHMSKSDIIRDLRKRLFGDIHDASDEYAFNLYRQLKDKPRTSLRVSMTHDKKSLSIVNTYLKISRNRHYIGQQVLYGYKPQSEAYSIKLYKQTRKGKEGYYLRSFTAPLKAGEAQIPDYQSTFGKNPMLKKILALFLDTDESSVKEVYEKAAYPVASQVFYGAKSDFTAPLTNLPGWRHQENNTLTKALQATLGFKPRKDFVKTVAQLSRNTIIPDMCYRKLRDPKKNYDARVLAGAINLIKMSRYCDLGFDVEDTVIRSLKAHVRKNRTPDQESSISPLLMFGATSPYSLSPIQKRSNAISAATIFSLCGPTISKRMLLEEGTNNLEGALTDESTLDDIFRMTLSLLTLPANFYNPIVRGEITGKTAVQEAIQTVQEAMKNMALPPQDILKDSGWNNTMNIQELHDVLMTASRYNANISALQKVELPENDLTHRVRDLDSVIVDNDSYKFIYPKTNIEVLLWANKLNNCMDSYVNRITEEVYSLVLVEKNDKKYAALGLTQRKKAEKGSYLYSKQQFYATNNTHLPIKVEQALLNHILTKSEQKESVY